MTDMDGACDFRLVGPILKLVIVVVLALLLFFSEYRIVIGMIILPTKTMIMITMIMIIHLLESEFMMTDLFLFFDQKPKK